MLAFPNELRTLSVDALLNLIEAYLVRSHDGSIYQGPRQSEPLIAFILNWTLPESGPIQNNNFLEAIQSGIRFNSTLAIPENTELLEQIFGPSSVISPSVIDDFAKYPIQNNLGNAWTLLQGYVESDDPRRYFENSTEQSWDNFLNETERVFFLTRGYGRPNKYISDRDLVKRQLYLSVQPTALIPLMDLFGVCPSKQNPDIIREKLVDTDLSAIDAYHNNAVEMVSNCLTGVTCKGNRCSEDHQECFTSLLKSLGVYDEVEYDPETQVFRSNLSQLNLYFNVLPEKEWSYDEVKNLPNGLVEGILRKLPDRQLVKIEVPSGLKLSDRLNLSTVSDRLRSKLMRAAVEFLTTPQYLVGSRNGQNYVYYGRLVDDQIKEITVDQIVESVNTHQALIDPNGHAMTLNEATLLNQSLNNPVIAQIIKKTQREADQNKLVISEMSEQDRLDLAELFEKLDKDSTGLEIERIKDIFKDDPLESTIFQFLLFQKDAQDWTPVAMTFQQYFENWYPLHQDLVKDTLKYYRQVLGE